MNIFAEVECQLSCNHAVLRIKKMLHALHVIFISILLKSRSEFMGHQTREMLHTRLIRTCLPLIEKWAFVLNSFIFPLRTLLRLRKKTKLEFYSQQVWKQLRSIIWWKGREARQEGMLFLTRSIIWVDFDGKIDAGLSGHDSTVIQLKSGHKSFELQK